MFGDGTPSAKPLPGVGRQAAERQIATLVVWLRRRGLPMCKLAKLESK